MFKILRALTPTLVNHNARSFGRLKKPRTESKQASNPGINKTLSALKDEGYEVGEGNLEDISSFEDSESDFFKVNESHRMHEKEMKKRKRFIINKIVEQKYFDEVEPNFLTWSEKEHIRDLHADDPQTWTVERLSASFPASEKGIKKLLKVVWKPADERRIQRHDASALRNWRDLKENNLEEVTPALKQHILNFSNRIIPPRKLKAANETIQLSLGHPISDEYSSIVAGHQKAAEQKYIGLIGQKDTKEKPPTNLTDKSTYNERSEVLTLQEVRSKIVQRLEDDKSVDLNERLMILSGTKEGGTDIAAQLESEPTYAEHPTTGVKLSPMEEKMKSEVQQVDYLQWIKIPKSVWKKGGTYKVDDCYYDDDGEFLYRVPGMMSKKA